MSWHVYMLECADKSFYTGITNNVAARLQKHEKGIGAKYTRGRGPLTLIYQESCATKGDALRREIAIKALSRPEKVRLAVAKKKRGKKKMTKITVYGIKNCDTMKKTFQWLDKQGVAYDFHDYKKTAPDAAVLALAFDRFGWETVVNRKGTTWRNLPESIKNGLNDKKALTLAVDNPSVIKRPLVVQGAEILLGFDPDAFKSLLPKGKQ